MNSVSVEHLFAEAGDRLGLQWVESEEYGCDLIEPVAECESGVCLVGHLNLIHPSRVQVLGDSELDYLGSLGDNSRRIALQQLFSGIASMVVIANGNLPPDYVVAQARTSHVPLFTSTLPTQDLINRLQFYLARMLAEHATMHGVFMDVLGVGVLISGPCGAGKSELALELITRGHRLVADDVTEFTRINPDAVSGVCPPLLRDFLEVRGMGILNIRAMFGDAALRVDKDLGLIIRLECMNNEGMQSIDRLHGTHRRTLVLDIEVAEVTLPVAPGRNLAVLVETAVRNHILRASGYDSAEDFIARQRLAIDRGDA